MTHLLFALAAAVVYALAAMLLKRSSDLGNGPLRTSLVCNVICAVLFLPIFAFDGVVLWDRWHEPTLIGLCYVSGQWFTFMSLKHGDVSVATPVMGVKVVMVAVFVTLIAREQLTGALWAAAALASLGVALINKRPAGERHHVGKTIILAMFAAASYAMFDVQVQMWSEDWGLGTLLPLSMIASAIISLLFIPKLEPLPASAKGRRQMWLIGGAIAISVQSLFIVFAIAKYQKAPEINVVYASRGLWSILLVWLVGHWFASKEATDAKSVLGWRFAGAALMLAAIALLFI